MADQQKITIDSSRPHSVLAAVAGLSVLAFLHLGFSGDPAHPLMAAAVTLDTTWDSDSLARDSALAVAVPVETEAVEEETPPVEISHEIGEGTASYYGSELAGRPTASGERFDPSGMTAAHPSLPFGTKLRVTNIRNGRSVVVRINDRGPFGRGRVIDLSYAAAKTIGMVRRGTAKVKMEVLK